VHEPPYVESLAQRSNVKKKSEVLGSPVRKGSNMEVEVPDFEGIAGIG